MTLSAVCSTVAQGGLRLRKDRNGIPKAPPRLKAGIASELRFHFA
jgi:hypothetical protein